MITVHPGGSVQTAIDEALPGDTIQVQRGTYYENINITKPLILEGLDRPIIDAIGSGSAIAVSANSSVVRGFEAVNSGGRFEAGINVKSCCNVIEDNVVSKNHEIGIYLDHSNGNIVRDNEAMNNIYGIAISDSRDNRLRNNSMHDNDKNFLVGSKRDDCSDIDQSNIINGLPIFYLVNQSDMIIDASSNAADVYCTNCRNITVRDLFIKDNYAGIHLYNTMQSRFINNTLTGNVFGIYLLSSSSNLVSGNTVADNSFGIYVDENSYNNTLIGNNASSNEYGVFVAGIGDASQSDLLKNNTFQENSKDNVFFKSSSLEFRG